MALINMAYGKSGFKLDTNVFPNARLIKPRACTTLADPALEFDRQFEKYLETHKTKFIKSLAEAKKVTILVPDQTRGTHFKHIIPHIIKKLNKANIERIHLLVCGGTHQMANDAQARALLGNAATMCSYSVHDADDTKSHFLAGETSRKTTVYLNGHLENAFIIGLGIVKQHYYAGYSGGRKIVLPGASARSSIKQNHALCFLKEEKKRHQMARLGSLQQNPVHLDMLEASKMVGLNYSVQLVLGMGRKPVALFAGQPDEVFSAAQQKADSLFAFDKPKQADFAVASAGGYPGDLNFLQAHKTIHHAHSFVKKGATIIVFAECTDGMGWDKILDWAKLKSLSAIIGKLSCDFDLPGQTALAMLEKAQSSKIYLLSDMPDKTVKLLGMHPIKSLQEGLQKIPDKDMHGVILPQGDLCVAL